MPSTGGFDRTAYHRWILANALGFTICMGLASLSVFARHIMLTDYPVTFSGETLVGQLIGWVEVPNLLLGTAIIGALQYIVLKRTIGVSAWWMPATVIGLGIGLLGTQVGILSMGQNTDLLYLSMCLCSFSFMIGGIPQWLLLRSKVPKAWIWVVASPLVLFLSYLAMWFTSLRIFGMFFYSSEDLGAEVLASLGDVLTNSGLSLGRHIPWFDVPIMIFAGGIAGGIVYGLSAGQILLRLSKYPMTEPAVLEASISTATPSQVQESLPGDMPSRVELDD